MLKLLMAWYGKLGPQWQARFRRWIVRPGKRLLSRGTIQQDGFVVAKRLDQSIPFKLWRENYYEPALSNFLRQNLKSGDVFFDVGANIGYFTLLGAACVGPNGQVHSFEPNPEPFKALQHNIQINQFKHVTANAVALSDQTGTVQLWFNSEIDSGLASLGKTSTLLTEAIACPAITLDSYVHTHQINHIKAMKVDIEGAELLAFRGGHQLLNSPSAPEIIALEAVAAHIEALNFTLSMTAKFLVGCGYGLYLLLHETSAHRSHLIQIDLSQPRLPEGTWVALKLH